VDWLRPDAGSIRPVKKVFLPMGSDAEYTYRSIFAAIKLNKHGEEILSIE